MGSSLLKAVIREEARSHGLLEVMASSWQNLIANKKDTITSLYMRVLYANLNQYRRHFITCFIASGPTPLQHGDRRRREHTDLLSSAGTSRSSGCTSGSPVSSRSTGSRDTFCLAIPSEDELSGPQNQEAWPMQGTEGSLLKSAAADEVGS